MAHPNKHIRQAIDYAEGNGWRFEKAGGQAHIYGTLYCGQAHRDCIVFVHSTPRNPEHHARRIRRKVERCPSHGQ